VLEQSASSGKEEALLVATACANPPQGRARWTLELLADAMVRLTDHESLSGEMIRRRLAENGLKPWRKDMWYIPSVDGEYVACMEDVLDLPKRLIRSGRWSASTRARFSSSARCASRFQPSRESSNVTTTSTAATGTVNLFVVLDVNRPWRKVKFTERRTAKDYAQCMRELVDVHYPDATCIRVVQGNLSTHSAGALYEAFPPAQAKRILRRLEFHYTPKHASWLSMVEIEIGVLRGQCLDRRIDDPEHLAREIAAWERQRNASGARIKWMFTTEKAHLKMRHAYPVTPKES
jgi:hypothetical protein